MIQHDFGIVSPDVFEEVGHDADGFVPHQPSISLEITLKNGDFRLQVHTSEKAGAVAVRNLFHSSPSAAMTLFPKANSIEYRWTGLGNLGRELVTTCKPRTKDQIHPVQGSASFTLIAAASARNMVVLGQGIREI